MRKYVRASPCTKRVQLKWHYGTVTITKMGQGWYKKY